MRCRGEMGKLEEKFEKILATPQLRIAESHL
jgi:hypothetical protein